MDAGLATLIPRFLRTWSAVVSLSGQVRARAGDFILDVQFDAEGGRLVVIGPNGAGKTSLLKALIGAIEVDHGWVDAAGVRLIDTSAGLRVPMELRGLGYLPQSYALFPHYTARQNVEFPIVGCSRSERRERAERLLSELGVSHLADRRSAHLSGGEMQRVALARALAAKPRALLLDEPLAAMDVSLRGEVRGFLVSYLSSAGLPTIIVSHDASDAEALSTRVLVMEEGKVTQSGTYAELVAAPATPFVERFLRSRR